MSKKRGGHTALIIIGCVVLALIILVVGLIFSQTKPTDVDNPSGQTGVTGDLKTGFLMSGTLSEGVNMDIYDGLILSGAETTYTEGITADTLSDSVEQMYQSGINVVLINGDTLYDTIDSIAAAHTDVTFLLFQTDKTNGSNISSITYKYEDQGFIQGVIAASLTTNNTSGALGEKEDGKINDLLLGYSLGSMQLNADARVYSFIDGVDGDLATHVEFFKSVGASTIVIEGSNEFLQSAITAGSGAFTTIITNQDVDVTQVKEVTVSCAFPVSKDLNDRLIEISNGTFAPGHYNKGAEILDIKYQDSVSDDVKNKVNEYIQEIKNGTLNVKALGL